jgi:hypothetical protein
MRGLIKLIIVLAVIAAAVYFSSDFLFQKASEQAVKFAPKITSRYGIEVKQPSFKSADVVSLNTVEWRDVSAKVSMMRRFGTYLAGEGFSFEARKIEISAMDLLQLVFLVDIEGLDIFRLSETGRPLITDRVYADKLKVRFQLDSITKDGIVSMFRGLFRNSIDLLKKGRCSMPVEFSGLTTLTVRGIYVEARVHSEREGNETVLVMNKEDLVRIAGELGEKDLTAGDINMLARNPARMPGLLKIRNKARSTAKRTHKGNPNVPEDAYRHVLWSYLLTKEYGPEFAEEVTNAHEIGSDNTWHERQMDYNNNAVGRRYAQAGYSEDSILGRVMADPNVIKYAR